MKHYILGLTAGAAVLFGACDKPIPVPGPTERSEVEVPLPPSPDLTPKPFEKFHDDGSYTVEGAMRGVEMLAGETVSVKGIVEGLKLCDTDTLPADLEDDSPVRPERLCDPPPQLMLRDAEPVSKRKLLVYGSMWSVMPTLKEGQEVTLTGRLNIVSGDGLILRQAGLLELDDLPEIVQEPAGEEE